MNNDNIITIVVTFILGAVVGTLVTQSFRTGTPVINIQIPEPLVEATSDTNNAQLITIFSQNQSLSADLGAVQADLAVCRANYEHQSALNELQRDVLEQLKGVIEAPSEDAVTQFNEAAAEADEKAGELNQANTLFNTSFQQNLPSTPPSVPSPELDNVQQSLPPKGSPSTDMSPEIQAALNAALVGICYVKPPLCLAASMFLQGLLGEESISQDEISAIHSFVDSAQGKPLSDADKEALNRVITSKLPDLNRGEQQAIFETIITGEVPQDIEQLLINRLISPDDLEKFQVVQDLILGEEVVPCDIVDAVVTQAGSIDSRSIRALESLLQINELQEFEEQVSQVQACLRSINN